MDARPWDEGTAVRGRAVCYFLIPVYVCTACVPGLHGAAVADIQPQEPQEPQEPTSPRRQHREIWVRPCSPDIAWPWCSALLCSALPAQFHAMPSALAGHRQAQKYSPSPSPEQCGRWSRAEATGGGPQATGHRRPRSGPRGYSPLPIMSNKETSPEKPARVQKSNKASTYMYTTPAASREQELLEDGRSRKLGVEQDAAKNNTRSAACMAQAESKPFSRPPT